MASLIIKLAIGSAWHARRFFAQQLQKLCNLGFKFSSEGVSPSQDLCDAETPSEETLVAVQNLRILKTFQSAAAAAALPQLPAPRRLCLEPPPAPSGVAAGRSILFSRRGRQSPASWHARAELPTAPSRTVAVSNQASASYWDSQRSPPNAGGTRSSSVAALPWPSRVLQGVSSSRGLEARACPASPAEAALAFSAHPLLGLSIPARPPAHG